MANEAFPIDTAQVVGLFMESVFYGVFCFDQQDLQLGIYLVSFFACLRALLWVDAWFKAFHLVNKKMLVAALLMFLFSSLDVAFHLRHNIDAFIHFSGNPIDAFEDTSNWINVMKMACYVAQTFIGDSILIFRCWIVYRRSWLVILLPVLLWLATTGCGIMTIYIEATMDTSGQLLNASSLVPFITSMLCLTLATNVLTTGLIVCRIWKIRSDISQRTAFTPNSPLTNVLIVLVESGLMYTASIVILFGLYMASNNAQYGVSNAVVQIIGITFNLIITSVDRGETTQPTSQNRSASHHLNSMNGNNVPLNMISVQTTINRYPDGRIISPMKSATGSASDYELEVSQPRKVAWQSP